MLLGKLERVIKGEVVGWMWESDRKTPANFYLQIDKVPYGPFKADLFRGDLLRRGIGSGAHGFRVKLKRSWFTAPLCEVTVSSTESGLLQGQKIAVSPAEIFSLESIRKFEGIDVAQAVLSRIAEMIGATEKSVEDALRVLTQVDEAVTISATVAVKPETREITALPPRRPKMTTRPVLSWLDQEAMVEQLLVDGKFSEKHVGSMIETAFKARNYSRAYLLGQAAQKALPYSYRVSNNYGRACIELGEYDKAIEALLKIKEREPHRHGAIFFLGRSYQRLSRFQDAYDAFMHCISINNADAKYHLEAGRMATQLRYGGYGALQEIPSYLDVAITHYKEALALDEKDFRIPRELAVLLTSAGRLEEARSLAELACSIAPAREEPWMELSRVCLRQGEIDGAVAAASRGLAANPDSDGAKFAVRVLKRMQFAEASLAEQSSIALLSAKFDIAEEGLDGLETIRIADGEVRAALIGCRSEWVIFAPINLEEMNLEAVQIRLHPWAGAVEHKAGSLTFFTIRRSLLLGLFEAGIMNDGMPLTELQEMSLAIASTAQWSEPTTPGLQIAALAAGSAGKPRPAKKTVMLISQFGIYKFGGAEQFLEQMARLYEELGHEVIMVGTRSEYQGMSGYHEGLRYTFVADDPLELVRFALQQNVGIVHVVSGLGFEIAAAFQYIDLKLIFGVHFWRELFFNATPSAGYYPDVDRHRSLRPEFSLILRQFDAIYANSEYTRAVVEAEFGSRLPVIYSLPYDQVDAAVTSYEDRHIILLANCRDDKGFSILLSTAKLLPQLHFVAIASQSDFHSAQSAVNQRSLSNVEILQRVDNMDELYKKSLIVLVPSYRFIETFSRVVIEAQRHGTPVIGSDRGNVPLLLEQSGTALPEDPAQWADEIAGITKSAASWATASNRALDNSKRYSFSFQKKRLQRLVSDVDDPILVGVGSGLGNVIHTTPLIRNLSQRLGRRVDVVVAGDYSDLLFVFGKDDYVNKAFLLNSTATSRRYSAVFLTHSFGNVSPRFSSDRVIASRDWQNFTADHELHESEFNLAAAQHLLGVAYEADDVRGYFLGNLEFDPTGNTIIGIHGGSKDGIWASKRWPHYKVLVHRLRERGILVASFGTADEYVEGTIDMTGGSISEMATRMLQCKVFVANDSGVMNVANALGIPLVALFGPTNVATRGPLNSRSKSLSIAKECAPCEVHPEHRTGTFLSGECQCISEIDVNEVLSTVLELYEERCVLTRGSDQGRVS